MAKIIIPWSKKINIKFKKKTTKKANENQSFTCICHPGFKAEMLKRSPHGAAALTKSSFRPTNKATHTDSNEWRSLSSEEEPFKTDWRADGMKDTNNVIVTQEFQCLLWRYFLCLEKCCVTFCWLQLPAWHLPSVHFCWSVFCILVRVWSLQALTWKMIEIIPRSASTACSAWALSLKCCII